ncbi:hypothetical protein M1N66_01945 [Thermodesulfovibrionales bacterium]|nr:hypothetical protein [Thermodesulfovibrionales bacterium]
MMTTGSTTATLIWQESEVKLLKPEVDVKWRLDREVIRSCLQKQLTKTPCLGNGEQYRFKKEAK